MHRITAVLGWGLLLAAPLAVAAGAAEPSPTAPTETVRRTADQAELERQRQGAQKPGEKDWSFGLFVGGQYDDNVLLLAKHNDEDADEDDWKSVNALFVDYRLVNSDERILAVRYGAYQTFLDHHDELQLTGNSLTLRHTEILAPVVLDVPASFTHYDLHSDKFLNLTSVSPSVFLQETPHLVGVLRTGYRCFEYYDVPNSGFDEPDRSSQVWEAGLEQWLLFSERGPWRLEAGWTFRREDAHEKEWSSDSGEARLGLRGELPWRLGLETSVTYTDQRFADENPIFDDQTERDRITACGLALSRPIWRHATATISYLFTDHESNVSSQNYRRNQVTLGVTFLF